MGTPIPPPEHYGHKPVEVDEEHPGTAPSSEENSPYPSLADHVPMDIDEQQPAMAPSLKEESRVKQRSLRQWIKQHKSTIGTIMVLYFIGTSKSYLAYV
jgi:hypothetical protein